MEARKRHEGEGGGGGGVWAQRHEGMGEGGRGQKSPKTEARVFGTGPYTSTILYMRLYPVYVFRIVTMLQGDATQRHRLYFLKNI